MKSKDIAKHYGLSLAGFDTWIRDSQVAHKVGLGGGITLPDDTNVEELVAAFRQYVEGAAQFAQEKQQAFASMLITSGFNFDGYTITRYSGYISGDDAISMARPTQGWLGGTNRNVADDLLAGLVHIRRNALNELKEAAHALGCNAVIGVDFDYLTLDPETVSSSGGTLYLPFLFAVTANGNAVVIEKNA